MTDIISHIIDMPRSVQVTDAGKTVDDAAASDMALRSVAEKFEAVFLSEMLKHTGLGEMPEAFNGGVGEAAFSDFLVHEYAEAIAKTNSTGLADQVYRAMKERSQT